MSNIRLGIFPNMNIAKVRNHFEAILNLCSEYKIAVVLPDELAESLYDELLECAILSTDLDKRMQNIRNQLDQVHSDGPAHIIGPSDLD